MVPLVRGYLSNHFVRGAVTGVGVITACAGLVELAGVFGLRRSLPAPDPAPHE
jgi:hypothetical protein